MAIIGNYHHVHLTSPDPRAAAEWYEEFLGAKIIADGELRGARNVRVGLGDCFLFIRGERADESISPAEIGKQRFGIDHICFRVNDIDGMLEAFSAKGGEIPLPLFELPNGNRAAYVAGPDGVVMELIEPAA